MTSQAATPYNANEIIKFFTISVVWLSITFGAVWIASWLVGMVIPTLIVNSFKGSSEAAMVAEFIQKVLTPIVAVLVFIPINATYMVLAERRGLALFTVRKGPNRVGPDGFLQTAADAVKLLFKEDITPRGADILMFTLAPIVFFAPSVFGAIPLLAAVTGNHTAFSLANLPTGIFFVLAAASVPVVGIVMGGWASNNKYSLVGGLRSAAQAISYEIPLVLAIVTVCLMVGTLDVVKIVQHQQGDYWLASWNILGGGALPDAIKSGNVGKIVAAVMLALSSLLLFGIYLTGACAEINRIPFDLPEAESELVSGYNTEYSGIKFAIFFLAEFTNLFIVSTIATVIFLGGGSPIIPPLTGFGINFFGFPSPEYFGWVSGINQVLAGFGLPAILDPKTLCAAFNGLFKTYSLVFFAILIRGTLPRFRIDQLMDFGWKRLIPLSLILLLAVTYLKELV